MTCFKRSKNHSHPLTSEESKQVGRNPDFRWWQWKLGREGGDTHWVHQAVSQKYSSESQAHWCSEHSVSRRKQTTSSWIFSIAECPLQNTWILSSTVHSSLKVEATPVSINTWMDNPCMVHLQSGVSFNFRRKESWYMWPHRWTVRILGSLESASHRRTKITGVYLCEVPRVVRPTESRGVVARGRGGGTRRCSVATELRLGRTGGSAMGRVGARCRTVVNALNWTLKTD